MNSNNKIEKTLLTCGVLAGPLFIVTFLIEGATRADYNPLRHPVSSLALGNLGWIQAVNFLITGLLLIVFAVGLWRTLQPAFWRSFLVGLVGIGLIGAGLFVTDPVSGYPPGTSLMMAEYSTAGRIHDLFSILTFLGLPLTCLMFGFRFLRARKYGWAVYSAGSGIAMFVFFVLASMGFSQIPGYTDLAGLFQRLSIVSGLGWISLLAFHMLNSLPRGSQ